jgi:hypothetical protein
VSARSASARATTNAAFSSSTCARSASTLARSSARAARMVVVARSVPDADAAAEAAAGRAFGAGVLRKADAGAGRMLQDGGSVGTDGAGFGGCCCAMRC